MKNYRISIGELKKLNSYDQGLMLRALIESPDLGGSNSVPGTRRFETEEDYQKWKQNGR